MTPGSLIVEEETPFPVFLPALLLPSTFLFLPLSLLLFSFSYCRGKMYCVHSPYQRQGVLTGWLLFSYCATPTPWACSELFLSSQFLVPWLQLYVHSGSGLPVSLLCFSLLMTYLLSFPQSLLRKGVISVC